MRSVPWGQPRLFLADQDASATGRFRLRVNDGAFGAPVGSLSLATAQARAAALAGHSAEIVDADGTAVVVTWTGTEFVVAPHGPAFWPERCRRLLAEHG
jgi:hypothetical protein